MRILILTSNHLRHKYLANRICEKNKDVFIISEVQPLETGKVKTQSIGLGKCVHRHFQNILASEHLLFGNHSFFRGMKGIFPIMLNELMLNSVYKVICNINPDVAIIFGSSWIKKPLLSLLPVSKTFNLHMGISPFYRGHSTNFWAFYNGEPEMVGSTILLLSPKLDKGDIVCHSVPPLQKGDDYYTFSMKAVSVAVENIIVILNELAKGRKPKTFPQFKVEKTHYYRSKDFTEQVAEDFLETYKKKFAIYLRSPKKRVKSLIDLQF